MNKIAKYQTSIKRYMKKKSAVSKLSERSNEIFEEIFEDSNMFASIVCFGLINNLKDETGVNVHGYHIAGSIEMLYIVSKICNNRVHYNLKYGSDDITVLIDEIFNRLYYGIDQNINTLSQEKHDLITLENIRNISSNCTNYTQELLNDMITSNVTRTNQSNFEGNTVETAKMIKTDIFCLDLFRDKVNTYKSLKRLANPVDYMYNTYGLVCRMALCLGWLISMKSLKDKNSIIKLLKKGEKNLVSLDNIDDMGNVFGVILKIYEDFKTFKRDIIMYSGMNMKDKEIICTNYVLTHGAKNACSLMTEAIEIFEKQCKLLDITIKPFSDIIKYINDDISTMTQDMSVDIDDDNLSSLVSVY